MKTSLRIAALCVSCALASCGARDAIVPQPAQVTTPATVRHQIACTNIAAMHALMVSGRALHGPASIAPPAMVRMPVLPASAMRSPSNRHVDGMLNWTQIQGSGSQVAAAADGVLWGGNNSLYVLSDQPSGSADKYIWQYFYRPAGVGGTPPAQWVWQNIPGMARQLAISPYDNMVFAVNAAGGVYAYCNGNWTSLGGGARSIAVDLNGFLYAASNQGTDGAIWQSQGGTDWWQMPGSGTALAGTWDPTAYTLPGSGATISTGGIYIVNSQGAIWHESPIGAFANLPGSASAVAPVTGGIVVLGNPPGSNGSPIYYYSYATNSWTGESGAATSISSDGTNLYAIGTSGAIYETPVSGL